jgi:hypothetical protein
MNLKPKKILKRTGNKKLQSAQATINRQTREAENYLYAVLDTACGLLDIQLCEWDINQRLALAVINQLRRCRKGTKRLRQAAKAFQIYDNCYNLVKALDIQIKPRYRWFYQLDKFIK